jgi:hypothetical protein
MKYPRTSYDQSADRPPPIATDKDQLWGILDMAQQMTMNIVDKDQGMLIRMLDENEDGA